MLDLILAREVYSFNTLLILMVTTEYNLILGGKSLLDLQKLSFSLLVHLSSHLITFSPRVGGIRTPHSKKLLVASGIRENFACKIRNPGFWNLVNSSKNPEFTNNRNPESKFHCQRLESTPGIRNPRLVIQIQVCLRFPHTGRTIFRGRFGCR